MFNQRPFKRSDRLSEEVRLAVSEVLLKNINISSKGLITITNVDMSSDLRYARIYFSHIDTEFNSEEIEKKLNQNRSKIRYYIGNLIDVQYVPRINFAFDKKYEKSTRIETILSDINKKRK